MLRSTLWHEPQYFQFFISDASADVGQLDYVATESLNDEGYICVRGLISVAVSSEYTRIPITVEYDASPFDLSDLDEWDRVVECSLTISDGGIVFAGCPDGPVEGKFGGLEVPPGIYRLRIHYGGQAIRKPGGETGDFYLIQIWPSTDTCSRTIKP